MFKIAKTNIELKILRVASTLGFVLYAIELYKDNLALDPFDFYIDLSAEIIFLLGIILSLKEKFKSLLLPVFYFPLIALIGLSFYYQRGLASSNEVNVMALIVIFSLTLSGRKPIAAIGLLVLTTSTALFFVEQKNHFLMSFTDYYTNNFMVMFISLGVIVMVSFAKHSFTKQHSRMEIVKQNLEGITDELVLKQESLRREKEILERLNAELEEKVQEKTAEIKLQDDAISSYINLALVQMKDPYEKCMQAVEELQKNKNGDRNIDSKIADSAASMSIEIEKLRAQIQEV